MADGWRSWGLHITLSQLIASRSIQEPILVMIDSVPPNQIGDLGPDMLPLVRRRWMEYNMDLPVFGQRYLSYLCDTLKPAIDASFRTLSGPKDTYSLGGSMGGLCSLLTLYRRPDVFDAGAACFSPVFQAPLIAEVGLNGKERFRSSEEPPRIYIDNGGDTSTRKMNPVDGFNDGGYWWLDSSLQAGVDGMVAALRTSGPAVDLCYHREPGGLHSERAWGRRAARPLRHLLRSRDA